MLVYDKRSCLPNVVPWKDMKSPYFLSWLAGLTCAASTSCSIRNADEPIRRNGSLLTLNGKPWKAVGANIYWLGLDENVVPPAGQPFYAPFQASYPTKGRVSEAMAVVMAFGGTMVRAHTLGVSTGNPLSVMPTLGQINEQAFESIDWAVYQAKRYGLRLLVPLTDNYVRLSPCS
jgi:mannan endo-1,4-beta-mannosidase